MWWIGNLLGKNKMSETKLEFSEIKFNQLRSLYNRKSNTCKRILILVLSTIYISTMQHNAPWINFFFANKIIKQIVEAMIETLLQISCIILRIAHSLFPMCGKLNLSQSNTQSETDCTDEAFGFVIWMPKIASHHFKFFVLHVPTIFPLFWSVVNGNTD